MIYFDNAATSWPKPEEVYHEVGDCLRRSGANPGRGGHLLARQAAEIVESARQELASYFKVPNANRFVFTSNATDGLNLAIKGALKSGDHAIISSLEHNSVSRPAFSLQEAGVAVTVVKADSHGILDPAAIVEAVTPNTRLIVLTHASNVTGTVLPIREVGMFAQEHEIIFLVDASQTVGEVPIDLSELPVDMLAFPGHKALLGPTGTGALYIREGIDLEPLKQGGTGTHSELPDQPREMPYRYESGTLNTSGIAGLGAALQYIKRTGLETISSHITTCTNEFIEGCRQIPGIHILGPQTLTKRVGVVSITTDFLAPDELAFVLDQAYEIAVRAGLHCSPLAHQTLGTFPQGAVRFSFGWFNSVDQVRAAIDALREIADQA